MRDVSRQLTVVEQVGVWAATVRPVMHLAQLVMMLPLVPIWTMFPHDGIEPGIVAVIVAVTFPLVMERLRRTDLNADEERQVLIARLTGWSTGDPRLDGWAVHRSAEAIERARRRGYSELLFVAVIVGLNIVPAVAAAILVSPWWLLCIAPAPLFLALPIARAQSDPAEVVQLLSPTPP